MNGRSVLSYRLWISKVHSLQKKNDAFYLGNFLVSQVQVQGYVIYLRETDSVTIIGIDDATGVVECTWFYKDYNPLDVRPGYLVRIIGKVTEYQGNISIRLSSPPFRIFNNDEEIDWALNVKKIWRNVYQAGDFTKQVKNEEKSNTKDIKNMTGNKFQLAESIRETGRNQISYAELGEICPFNPEACVVELIQDGFLIPQQGHQEISSGEFKINTEPYHPKEHIKNLFSQSSSPIKYETIMKLNQDKCVNCIEILNKSIIELLDENYIYEVSDNLYDIIKKEI